MLIQSLLDNDFYKFTMMQAVCKHYPQAQATYGFINRTTSDTFTLGFLERLKKAIAELEALQLTDAEYAYLQTLGIFSASFLEKLRHFRFKKECVRTSIDSEGQLTLTIEGFWWETILFEVPLLAIISELYQQHNPCDLREYWKRTEQKIDALSKAHCHFADYGTRRRRSFAVHDAVIQCFSQYTKQHSKHSRYLGTSNVQLSKEYGTPPLGTMAHEWIMAHGALFGVSHAHKNALEKWLTLYTGPYALALSDTYTADRFFEDFTADLAQAYSGIRQDSGDPLIFIDKALLFYEKQGIDPKHKKIVFSDSLNCERAAKIEAYAKNRIQTYYGIGTFFTNDVPGQKALNIVIKLSSLNGIPVFKTTDSRGKECWRQPAT